MKAIGAAVGMTMYKSLLLSLLSVVRGCGGGTTLDEEGVTVNDEGITVDDEGIMVDDEGETEEDNTIEVIFNIAGVVDEGVTVVFNIGVTCVADDTDEVPLVTTILVFAEFTKDFNFPQCDALNTCK